jgi:hypothetical protein
MGYVRGGVLLVGHCHSLAIVKTYVMRGQDLKQEIQIQIQRGQDISMV